MVTRADIRCRQISEVDVTAVATLLARGFPRRSRDFWLGGFEHLRKLHPPSSLPKYGYILECDGVPVGVLLAIFSTIQIGDANTTRCCLSAWYVEPEFRTHATLLVSHSLKYKDVSYLNVMPAEHTFPIIEALGFRRYSDGIFVAVPILNGWFRTEQVKMLDARERPEVAFNLFEQDILLQHADLGCMCVWCVTSEYAYPFAFRPRLVETVVPCMQLIYCRDIADFVRFSGPIGRFLGRRGRFCVLLDANGSIPGLVGKFFPGKMPKYFKGPHRPRLGDLAYTEIAVLGV